MLSGEISTHSIQDIVEDLVQDADFFMIALIKMNFRRIENDGWHSSEQRELARVMVEHPTEFVALMQSRIEVKDNFFIEEYVKQAGLEWRK